jgi:hypothetical protein
MSGVGYFMVRHSQEVQRQRYGPSPHQQDRISIEKLILVSVQLQTIKVTNLLIDFEKCR